MRVLIVNTDYPPFLQRHYTASPELTGQPFSQQMRARMDSGFGVTDAYSNAFNRIGHQAIDLHANNLFAQHAWAREHAPHLVRDVPIPLPSTDKIPWGCKSNTPINWLADTFIEQVRQFQPDVLINQAMDTLAPDLLRQIRPHTRLIVGQHAAIQLDRQLDLIVYDLAISSFPPTVDYFRQRGLPSRLNRLAFDSRWLTRLPDGPRDLPLTFIGSFYDVHRSRTIWLETIARRFDLKVWGPPPPGGFGASPLARCYQGQAWGLEMLTLLKRSRVTLNHHGDVPPHANNFRLYEATGCGALLITDDKPDLHEMFESGRHVIAYRDSDECLAQIGHYLANQSAATAIATAGQQHTLARHTFIDRVQQLMVELEAMLGRNH